MYSLIGFDRKVIQLAEKPFDVAKPLFWVECDKNITAGMYYSKSGKFEKFNKYIDLELEVAKLALIDDLHKDILFIFDDEPVSLAQIILINTIASSENDIYLKRAGEIKRYSSIEFTTHYEAAIRNYNIQLRKLHDTQEKQIKKAKTARELIK